MTKNIFKINLIRFVVGVISQYFLTCIMTNMTDYIQNSHLIELGCAFSVDISP